MKVLVTGGTGVVGKSAVDHLLERGHTVRLLSRHAEEDSRQWASGVEPYPGDVGNPEGLRGSADGCDAVLHVAGIVAENPPEVTFQDVNVEGTRRMVEEAARAGAKRFVYVSSLGAERGASAYHRSKKAAEDVVRAEAPPEWLVLRPGNVYGPGDEVISLMLKMVRTLPAVPVIGAGDHPFQPVWVEDLGEVIARAVEGEGGTGAVLDLAGTETTSMNGLLDHLEEITGKDPVRVPIPEWMARMGTGAASALGVDLPVNADQITMLLEGNLIPEGEVNALTGVFGVKPTPLREGLRKLADALPEMLPSDGVGRLHRERFWADIRGSKLTPEEILKLVQNQFQVLSPNALLDTDAEPQTPSTLEVGETLTLAVPLRGNVQVRVQEATPRAITSVTIEGHFFAGVIRFMTEEPAPGTVRFEVRAYTRAANQLDRVAIRTVGKVAQTATWSTVVQQVIERSGGEAPEGVQVEDVVVSPEEAEAVERWTEGLVMKRRREESPDAEGGSSAGKAFDTTRTRPTA
ncbi:MAG: DUF1990 family protein [Gemmatimonadetes bacterium]|nr:DUF1990 family protein [Gemmatimonadota bacterium]